ncbi:MAG: M6 family metalloprotease domain-containing protein [Muribaculaceae bacterium]|nr:M6 family metalloprotease domain-containing protein [Muribaculaceae bacterium]
MNKKNLYALAAMAAVALPALSRPASPELMRHTNPDGTVVEFYMNGDENFNYLTDKDRSVVLERQGQKIIPMVRNGRNLMFNEANINMLKAERGVSNPVVSASAGKVNRMASLDASGRSTYPTKGNVRACVILLEYPDTPFSMADPVDQFSRFCNEKGYSDYNSKGSAKDYFEACSGGQFSPTFDVYGPIKLKHDAPWYVGADDPSLSGYQHNARFGEAIKEALEALDPTVDFSIYDYDGNGEIDNIFFFYSGYGQADTGNVNTVWPHQANFWRYTNMYPNTLGLDRLFVDNVEMTTYACSCELNGSPSIPPASRPWVDGIGAFCHEYSHVLGLPDYYDVLKSGTVTPGAYTIMDGGSYNDQSTCPPAYNAYEKWVCNWLELEDLTDGQDVTLHALASENPNAYRIRIPRVGTNRYYSEYYILEARNEVSWDKSLPSHGMLIWRINYDANAWAINQVNVNKNPRIQLIKSGSGSQGAFPGEQSPVTYITPSTGQLYSTSLKKPISAILTNIYFDYDNPTSEIVTFEYNKYGENQLTTVLHSDVDADQDNHTLTLKWDAVADADSYQLTVKRRNSTNTEFTVDGLDEKNVGNVTSWFISNLTDTQWKQTFTAYVRPVAGLPSTKTSNVLTFVPANLSAIDGIEAEIPVIYGGKGEVIAPEGARVYSLNGVETGRQNLAPGVYIVVTPGVTAKVVVR